MYEKAKYFSNKFIRNAIGLLLVSVYFIYRSSTREDYLNPAVIVAPLLAILWLYLGLWIRKKLKTKSATEDSGIIDEGIPGRQVQIMFTFLFVGLFFLFSTRFKYAEYFLVVLLLGYVWWLYMQMKQLYNYFKS